MSYFPMFIDLKEKKCLIAGGGKVALRKAESLLKFEGQVKVIAPVVCGEIKKLEGDIQWIEREVELEDLSDCFLVIAATNCRKVNHQISAYCKERHIFVNVIDCKEECSFVFPATVKREDISIGITTSGASPVLSSTIRKSVEKAVPDYYGILSLQLGEWREELKERVKDEPKRREIFRNLVLKGLEQEGNLSREDFERMIEKGNMV